MAKILILEVKVGLYPGVFKFADKGVVADSRLQPFRNKLRHMTLKERLAAKDEVIRVDKLYAPQEFFDLCRTVFERHADKINTKIRLTYVTADKYVHFINSWLAIVDHYGLDADYDPDFVRLVDEFVIPLVVLYAYRKEGDEVNTGLQPADGTKTFGQIFSEVDNGRKRRYFNKNVYPDPDFSIAFDRFLYKYNK